MFCRIVHAVQCGPNSPAHALGWDKELRAAGASMASVVNNIDTSTPDGRLTFTILAALGQHQRETMAERTSRGLRERQRKGLAHGARPPYGWARQDGRLIAVESEQRVLARFMAAKADGASLYRITEDANADGLRTRVGNEWNVSLVARIIRRGLENRNPEISP